MVSAVTRSDDCDGNTIGAVFLSAPVSLSLGHSCPITCSFGSDTSCSERCEKVTAVHLMCLVGRVLPPMFAGPGTAASPTHSPNNPAFQDTFSTTRQNPKEWSTPGDDQFLLLPLVTCSPVAFHPDTTVPSHSNPECCMDPPAPCTIRVFVPSLHHGFFLVRTDVLTDALQNPQQHQAERISNKCARRDSVSTSTFQIVAQTVSFTDFFCITHCSEGFQMCIHWGHC